MCIQSPRDRDDIAPSQQQGGKEKLIGLWRFEQEPVKLGSCFVTTMIYTRFRANCIVLAKKANESVITAGFSFNVLVANN